MKISFLVTTHNEDNCLYKLLSILEKHIENNQQDEVVILDDFSDNKKTIEILKTASNIKNFKIDYHKLNKNYSEHKNFGNNLCSGDFIFAIDADEYPNEILLNNLHDILIENSSVDLYHVPRFNIIHGLTQNFIDIFNWSFVVVNQIKIDVVLKKKSESYQFLKNNNCILEENFYDDNHLKIKYNCPCINLPDYQGRIYRNSENIKWNRTLHEHIIGFKIQTKLPIDSKYGLIHEKTIERQWEQNEFYNKNFSIEDNVRLF